MFLKDLFKKRRRCNHDLKDENTTLRRLSKMNMVFPPQKNYICEECKKIFFAIYPACKLKILQNNNFTCSFLTILCI